MQNELRKNRRRKKSLLSKSRWAAYAAAGAATALGVQEAAEADIFYSGIENIRIEASDPSHPFFHPFYFGTDGDSDLVAVHLDSGTEGGWAYVWGGDAGSVRGFSQFNTYANAAFYYASNLKFGQRVQPINPGEFGFFTSGTMALKGGYDGSRFLDSNTPEDPSYVGFVFNDSEGTHYGWLRVVMDGAPGNAYTVTGWAYGGDGEAISAGQVPEPGSLGLLATGAIGLLLWRRVRRRDKSED